MSRRETCLTRLPGGPTTYLKRKGRIKGRDLDNWLQAEAESFERTPLNIGESQDSVTVLAEVHDFTPKELEIDLEPKRVRMSPALGGRAKPANEGQVKTGQRRMHSGH